MGRRHKRFIDRRQAETYQLIYHCADEDGIDEERVLVEKSQIPSALPTLPDPSISRNAPSSIAPPFFSAEELTEDQQREIRELGLPSDGYNYLKHLRSLKSVKGELPIRDAPKSGGIYVKNDAFSAPEPETRYIHAKNLTLHTTAQDEMDAEDMLRTITTTAFSRVVPDVKGTLAQEVQDVEAMLEELEGRPIEDGDMLDSFVLDATRTDRTMSSRNAFFGKKGLQWIALPEEDSSGDEGEGTESSQGDVPAKSIGRSRFSRGDADSHSSFSERWKGVDASDFVGRRERTGPLEVIDEMFETVLDAYDEEELGELEDEVEDGMSLEQLRQCLQQRCRLSADNFQPEGGNGSGENRKTDCLPQNIGPYKLLKPKSRVAALKEQDTKALEATKKLMQSMQADSRGEEWEDILISVRSDREMDCESAWSCRTHSTQHQPSLIVSTRRAQAKPATITADLVKVSNKSGFPVEDAEVSDSSHDASDGDLSDGDSVSMHSCQNRPRDETAEEKRMRKQAVKAAQKAARLRKKQTKMLYRQERTRQQKQMAGMMTKNASVIEL